MGLGIFQQATLAMMGQSHKLNTISQNLANINTDGYKRTDTEFQTLVGPRFTTPSADTGTSRSLTSGADYGGVIPIDLNRISQQGQIRVTDRNLDIAIDGDGFFMVSPDINVSGNILYTRRGSFELNLTDRTDTVSLDDGVTTATVNQGFLADQFGNFILGVTANADGTFNINDTPQPLRIDQFAFQETGVSTTVARIDVNLPANDSGGTVQSASLQVIDNDFRRQDVRLDFTKVIGTNNTWDFRMIGDDITSATASPGGTFVDKVSTATTEAMRFSTVAGGGGVITAFTNTNPSGPAQLGGQIAGFFAGLKPGDSITIAGSTGIDNTYTIATVSENQAEITLTNAVSIPADVVDTVAVMFSSTANIPQRLTFGNNGQLSSDDEYKFNVTFTSGKTAAFTLDVSEFTQFAGAFDVSNREQNGAERASIEGLSFGPGGEILADFTNGTRRELYKLTLATFPNPNGLELRTGHLFEETQISGTPTTIFADDFGLATIVSNALEGSNSDMGVEMARLIAAQAAYNVAATTFKTADEMLQEAGDLKR
ncbi:MAG: flagellar hook-basal body complex protein [Rhodospirillaceae bacterium]